MPISCTSIINNTISGICIVCMSAFIIVAKCTSKSPSNMGHVHASNPVVFQPNPPPSQNEIDEMGYILASAQGRCYKVLEDLSYISSRTFNDPNITITTQDGRIYPDITHSIKSQLLFGFRNFRTIYSLSPFIFREW